MPRFYRKQLTASLAASLEEQLQLESGDQFSVLEELALVRETAGDVVAVYAKAHSMHELEPNEQTAAMKMSAGALLRDIMEQVVGIAEKAAKIHFTTKNVFTALDLKQVVNQITRIMYDVCGTENQHVAEQFEYAINNKLKLPSSEGTTTITPSQTVIEMDGTIGS